MRTLVFTLSIALFSMGLVIAQEPQTAKSAEQKPSLQSVLDWLESMTEEAGCNCLDQDLIRFNWTFKFNYNAESTPPASYLFKLVRYLKFNPVDNRNFSTAYDSFQEYEYKYIFDFSDFDPARSEVVKVSPGALEEIVNPGLRMSVEDIHYKVVFRIKKGGNPIIVRHTGPESMKYEMSIYFRDYTQALEYLGNFNMAVKMVVGE